MSDQVANIVFSSPLETDANLQRLCLPQSWRTGNPYLLCEIVNVSEEFYDGTGSLEEKQSKSKEI